MHIQERMMLALKKLIYINILCLILMACSAEEPTTGTSPLAVFADQTALLSMDEYQAWCVQAIADAKKEFSKLEAQHSAATVENFLEPLEQLWLDLSNTQNEAILLRDVHPDLDMQHIARSCAIAIADIQNQIYLSPEIYADLIKLSDTQIEPAVKYYIDDRISHFQRAGVNQPEETRAQIRQLFIDTQRLATTYNDNIRKATRTVHIPLTHLKGLPADTINTRPVTENNTIAITTDKTDLLPFMRYTPSAQARMMLYQQAAAVGYPENITVLKQLLAKRYQLARLLGYDNWAEYITARNMLSSSDRVQTFLDEIAEISHDKAQHEYAELLQQLQQQTDAAHIKPWDTGYLQEKIKQEKYAEDKLVRTYFAYDNVRDGIFKLAEQLFDISIEPWDTPVWHTDVESWQVRQDGQLIGYFYLDMHPRANKYKHNQHLKPRFGVKDKQLPVSALIANIPGGRNQPQLLEHRQVRSFLHEFGHLLHHIFSGRQQWIGFSGNTNIPNFIEVPSKMLEQWMWSKEVLQSFAKNDKGEVIPDELIEKIQRSYDFGVGLDASVLIYRSALSLQLHNQDPDELDLAALDKQLQNKYLFISDDSEDYYYRFGHLSTYSAEYYIYLLSEIIANDFFSEFSNNGILNQDIGMQYRKAVLEPGGSLSSRQLIHDFLGRDFTLDATKEIFNMDN